ASRSDPDGKWPDRQRRASSLSRDHAAPEPTLALVKAASLACGRSRPLAWCSRPRKRATSPARPLALERASGFGCRRGPPRGYPVAVLFAEAAGRIFGQRVAVTLPVGGAHEGSDDIEIPVVDLGRLTPEVGEPKVDIELQQVDAAWAFRHGKSVESRSDDTRGKPCFPRGPPFFLEPALQQRLRLPPGEARLRRRYAASPWASFVLDRLEFPHARLRRRPSSYSKSGVTPPARSTSRASSGWTTRGRSGLVSLRARRGSCSPSTRRSRASWVTSSATRSSVWPSGCSTTRPGSRRWRARSSSSSIQASCSAASAQTRSTRSSSSWASSASGSKAKTARCRA